MPGSYKEVRLYGSNNPTGFVCNTAQKVNQLAAALREAGEENKGANVGTFVVCNGHTWSVWEACQQPGTACEGKPGSTVELVVDGEYCGCGAGNNVVRPGIGTSGWGGLDSDPCDAEDQTITIDFIPEDHVDNEGPVMVSCPSETVVADAEPGSRSAVVAWPAPTARDYNDNILLTSIGMDIAPLVVPAAQLLSGVTAADDADGIAQATFALGTATITYTFVDAAGNAGVCSFGVLVTDATAPSFVGCPASMAYTLPAADAGVVVEWATPTAVDDLDGDVVVGDVASSPTKGLTSGATFPAGNTTVNYTAADSAGNEAACEFVVQVVDLAAPVFASCPNSFDVGAGAAERVAAVTWPAPEAVDVADGAVELIGPLISPAVGDAQKANGGTYPLFGTTIVEYIAMDAAGNVAWCRFNFTVVDDTPPTFSGCPESTTHVLAADEGSFESSWTAPTAFDFVDDAVVAVELVQSRNGSTTTLDKSAVIGAASSFTVVDASSEQDTVRAVSPAGVFVYEYAAEDAAGNVGTCAVTVNVTDVTPPVVSGCQTSLIETTVLPGDIKAKVEWDAPAAVDNVDGAIHPSVTGLPAPRGSDGAFLFLTGEHVVTYHFEDGSGNTAECSIQITVHYRREPVFEAESFAAELLELVEVGTLVKTFKILCSIPFTSMIDVAASTPELAYGEALPFTLGGPVSGGDTFTITTTELLDRESIAAFTLAIKATVTRSGFTETGLFAVAVADANDNAPSFAVPTLYGFVPEGAAADTEITLYAPNGTEVRSNAHDPDALENGAIVYHVNGDERFGFDAAESKLVLKAGGSNLDREESSRIVFTLTATDGAAADDQLSTTVVVVITVEDVNDNPPTITDAGKPFVVNSTLPGTVVGVVTAFDQDADASIVYEIVAGSVLLASAAAGGELFAVHRTSGLLSVLAPLADPPSEYTFVLRVSDGTFETTETMTLQVQPNPACVDRGCEANPCYGPPSCIGEGVCVLGAKVDVAEHPECNPSCTCSEDAASSVLWSESDCGLLRTAPCPTDAYGTVTRTCGAAGMWGEADFSSCVRTAILKLAATGVSDEVNIDQLSQELAGASDGGEGLGALDVANIGVVIRDVAALSQGGGSFEPISQQSAAGLVESASNTLDASVAVQRGSQQAISATTGTIDMSMVFSPWSRNTPLTALEQNDLAAEVWRHAPQLSSIVVSLCTVDDASMTVTFSAELRAAYRDECVSSLGEMMAATESERDRRAAPANLLLAGLQADASGLYSDVAVDLALAPSYKDTPLSITTAVEALLRSVAGGLAASEVVKVETKNIAAEARKLNCSAAAAPIVYTPITAANDSITVLEAVVRHHCVTPGAEVDVMFVVFEQTELFETAINSTNLTSATAASSAGAGVGSSTVAAATSIADGADGGIEAALQECQVDPAARPPSRVMAVQVSSTRAWNNVAAAPAASAPMVSLSMALPSAPDGYVTSPEDTLCVFWDHAEEGWSSDGCRLVADSSSSNQATCVCSSENGHFAALPILKTCVLPSAAAVARPAFALYLVVLLTAVPAYLFVFVTFARFAALRTVQKYILMHTSLAIAVALTIASVSASRVLEDGESGCRFSAALGYYMFLVVLVWQAIDAWHFWRTYSHVAGYGVHMGEKESQWPLFVTAYGVPILATAVVAAVSSEHFGSEHSCWLGRPASAAFWVPLVLGTLFNFGIFTIISARQCGDDPAATLAEPSFNTRRETEFKRNLRASGVHLPFHAFAWAAGIVSVQDGSHEAFAAAFLVFATLAGGSSVLFNVLLEDEVWMLWGVCCKTGGGSGRPKTPAYTHTQQSDSQVEELALSDLGRGPLSSRSHPLSATSHPRSAASNPHSAISRARSGGGVTHSHSGASTVGVLPNLPNLAARSPTVRISPPNVGMNHRMLAAAAPATQPSGLKRSNSTDSRHKRRAATSAHISSGYWEGIPVQSLGRNATPNMHAPVDEFSGFDSTSGDGWPQNRAEEEMYGMDVPLPGFPQTQVLLAGEHASARGDLPPLHPSTWDAVARGAAAGNSNQIDDQSDSTDYLSHLNTAPGIMVRDDLAMVASSPTRELLQQRENSVRWSAPLTTGEEQTMTDATLLRTAKVLALGDHKLTYLLHFEPGELRLLQDKLHEL